MERTAARQLTDDERVAFLAEQDARVQAQLRRLRDECNGNPALMVTYGFAAAAHPPTVGLMAYLHDEVRQESARRIRQDVADRAMGKLLEY